MEKEISVILMQKYKLLGIAVYYIDLRKYKIVINFLHFTKEIDYLWDAHLTTRENIKLICNEIDNFIIETFKKGV